LFSLLLILLAGGSGSDCVAASFSTLYAFGDSFTDTGNVFAATRGLIPPDPPYFHGRFSDGTLWVERLAERLELPLVANGANPDRIVGNNFAAGGARVAVDVPVPPLGTVPSVLTQVRAFVAGTPAATPEALYVVYAGYDDLRIAADPEEALDPPARDQIVDDAVTGVRAALSELAAHGATYFLVPNLADLGATPEARLVRNNAAVSSELTAAFNSMLEMTLDEFERTRSVQLFRLDTFALANQLIEDATENGGTMFGITNIETPAFAGSAGSPGADPTTSLFVDGLHISATAHRHLGDLAFAAVPEPQWHWLTLLTVLLFVMRAREVTLRDSGNNPFEGLMTKA
jgi:outer membrane lipase/esterase